MGQSIHSQAWSFVYQSGDMCRGNVANILIIVLKRLHEVGHSIHSKAPSFVYQSGDMCCGNVANILVVVLERLHEVG